MMKALLFRRGLAAAALVAAVVAVSGWKDKVFVRPQASHARVYAAHDEHKQEKVTIGAEPYDTHEKLDIFVHKYGEHDLLPVFVVVTNDGDQPVALTQMKVELITGMRAKLQTATIDDVERRLGNQQKRSSPTPRVGVPIPLPRRQKESPRSQMEDELDLAMFRAKAVEPRGTQAGFFFFDVAGVTDPLRGAKLYFSGLKGADMQELYFFEIPLDAYLDTKGRR